MMCHACSIPIQSPTVMHKYCTKCVLRSRELRGNDKVELPRKQSVRRPVPSASSSSSHDGEFLKSIRETTKHLNTPSPSPSPHQQQQHVLTPPPPVEQKQLKALEKITDSIAHQESLIVSMREALDRQKRFAAASNSITSTTGTADSYTADELLDTLPSEQHRFEYLDT
ncbi:hypothetical protein DYB36_005392 [Aphanomyces astaci]|uniref:Uncharacterized protein n=1 Tax=Aphanomyces astaci TaxID=112090 RepID=A0A397APG2_APHAT|nr:hypothetical protein DYB36_005392 [Aphanomyces astaci]